MEHAQGPNHSGLLVQHGPSKTALRRILCRLRKTAPADDFARHTVRAAKMTDTAVALNVGCRTGRGSRHWVFSLQEPK